MRPVILALITLLCAPLASASPKHWYTDKKWWAGTAIIAASVTADYYSTAYAMQHNPGIETNMLLGPHPSTRGLCIVGASAFTYWTAIHAVDWHISHDDTRVWRIVGYMAMPVAAASVHGSAAAHNFTLPTLPVINRDNAFGVRVR